MNARTRWQLLNYGPGVTIAALGIGAFVATGDVWALAWGALGLAQFFHARATVHLYKSAYFRGRGDQLHDLADGRWPHPRDMDPQPWDPIGSGRAARE